ncbi:hypothetical protein E2C01_048978 [Portunus trituberculatus]|uniref:Uncharacterized protein n=1 Tax=Portunus trituberculatus TaxID=210409 RepID=A0A5B7GCK6_PORTR|nr:hypothetical protein [Portunus trituberculatus]
MKEEEKEEEEEKEMLETCPPAVSSMQPTADPPPQCTAAHLSPEHLQRPGGEDLWFFGNTSSPALNYHYARSVF